MNYYQGLVLIIAVQIALITLRVSGNINWSWVWVLAPMWAPVACLIIGALTGVLLLKSYRNY